MSSGIPSLNSLFKSVYGSKIERMFGTKEAPVKWINNSELAKKVIPKENIIREKDDRLLILDGTENSSFMGNNKFIICSPKNVDMCYNMVDSENYRGFNVYTDKYAADDTIYVKNVDHSWEYIFLQKEDK